jgi:hypothetical protein
MRSNTSNGGTDQIDNMRLAQRDNGRWVVEFRESRFDLGADNKWYSFDDQQDYATKAEARAEMQDFAADNARTAAAERKYQSQIAYACGERE